MRKEKLWKGMLAVFTCTALALSAPPVYAVEQGVSALEENENGFQIEDIAIALCLGYIFIVRSIS